MGASDDAHRAAVEDACPEPPRRRDADVEKLAVPVPVAPEPDARLLPPERLAQRTQAALCTPDAVPYAGRSYAAMALPGARAQSELPVSMSLILAAVAVRPARASQKRESRFVPQVASLPSDERAAQELVSFAASQQTRVAEQLAALEPKMSA